MAKTKNSSPKPRTKSSARVTVGPKVHSSARANPAPLRLEYVDPATLDDNPSNWRIHPAEQLSALEAVLEDPEIGWAGALLFNERTRRLIDGHGRKKNWTAKNPGKPCPVLIGSWSEEAEAKILQTLDPIGAMAEANAEKLDAIRLAAPLTGDAFKGLRAQLDKALDEARAKLQTPPSEGSTSGGNSDGGDPVGDRNMIIIYCETEMHQTELLDEFEGRKLKFKALVG